MRTHRARLVSVGALLALTAGCAAQPPPAAPPPAPTAVPGPSPQARMVCEFEAREDIALTLGVEPATVGPLRFADGTTTCRYAYPPGGFTLTVQDLPDAAATTAAFEALAARRGRVQQFDLGDAPAFSTTDGSVVMRKDDKVLLVDVVDLPDPFGRPPVARGEAALRITKAVLGCWTGA